MEYQHRKTGIVFVQIPAGTFEMGIELTDSTAEADRIPRHRVILDEFWISKYEVTVEEWEAQMGDQRKVVVGGRKRPVVNVAWDECVEFCRKTGLSLPTEAQWEYACRAGSSEPFGGFRLEEVAWYSKNSELWPSPVGEKKPNGFGLHDVHGNVEEWCEDTYDPESYWQWIGSVRNPVGHGSSGLKVVRGGSWFSDSGKCDAQRRGWVHQYVSNTDLGFRVVFNPKK